MGKVYSICNTPCMHSPRLSDADASIDFRDSTIKMLHKKLDLIKLESYYKDKLIENLT